MPQNAEQFINNQTPEPLRKVRPVPGFEEYAPEAAFGGGKEALGQATAEAAVESGKLIEYHKKAADDAMAQSLHARFLDEVNELMYNPQKGYMLRHGKDAMGYNNQDDPNNPQSTIEKLQAKYLDQTNSKEQKALLERFTDDTITKAMQTMRYHSFQETQYQAVAANNQQVGSIVSMAVNDPAHIDDTIDDQGNKVPGYMSQIMASAYKGGVKPDKVIESMNSQVATKMMIDGEPARALEYLKTHPTDPDTQKRLTGELEKTKEDLVADTVASHYMQKTGDPEEASKQIRADSVLSKKEQDEAVKRVQFLGRQKESLIKQKTEQQFESASSQIQDYAKQHPGVPFDAEKVVGEGVWNSLGKDSSETKKMQIALKALGDPSTTGDVTVLNDFLTLPKDTIMNMSKVDFAHDYLTKLNAPQMARAKSVYDSFHKGDKSPATLKVTVPVAMLKDTMTRIYPIDKKMAFKNWPSEYRQTFNNLNSNIEQEMEYFESVHQKEPNAVEIQKMIDGQLKNEYQEKHFFGLTSKPRAVTNYKMGIVDPKVIKSIGDKYPQLSEEQQFRFYQAYQNKDSKMAEAILKENE